MPDPTRLIDAVLAQYDLKVQRITAVRATNNLVVRLDTAADRFALRLHRPGYRTPQQTRSELTYLTGLAATGTVGVPRPIMTNSGDLVAVVETDGRRHGSVVTWLEGVVLRPGEGAGPKTLFRIGEALANIHRFSESFAAPAGFDLPVLDAPALFEPRLIDRLETIAQRRMFDEVRQRVVRRFEGLKKVPATSGVLHDDFILLNCLHRGPRTAVIDFDDCGWGFYLQDFGGILGNLKDYPNYRSLRRPFLDGYRSVRTVPSEAEGDLELMIALRHCTSALWLLDLGHGDAIPREQFERILAYRFAEIEASLEALRTQD